VKKQENLKQFNTNKIIKKPANLNLLTFESIPTFEFEPSDQFTSWGAPNVDYVGSN